MSEDVNKKEGSEKESVDDVSTNDDGVINPDDFAELKTELENERALRESLEADNGRLKKTVGNQGNELGELRRSQDELKEIVSAFQIGATSSSRQTEASTRKRTPFSSPIDEDEFIPQLENRLAEIENGRTTLPKEYLEKMNSIETMLQDLQQERQLEKAQHTVNEQRQQLAKAGLTDDEIDRAAQVVNDYYAAGQSVPSLEAACMLDPYLKKRYLSGLTENNSKKKKPTPVPTGDLLSESKKSDTPKAIPHKTVPNDGGSIREQIQELTQTGKWVQLDEKTRADYMTALRDEVSQDVGGIVPSYY